MNLAEVKTTFSDALKESGAETFIVTTPASLAVFELRSASEPFSDEMFVISTPITDR